VVKLDGTFFLGKNEKLIDNTKRGLDIKE